MWLTAAAQAAAGGSYDQGGVHAGWLVLRPVVVAHLAAG